jgi:GntR family transcriptional regulator
MSAPADPEIALNGGIAICDQIQTQIRDCILSGRLLPGEQLPTVRSVAVELSINPAAIDRAYGKLEDDGFLTSVEGSGTFVAFGPWNSEGSTQNQQALNRLCSEFLAEAARHGFSSLDAIRAIETLGAQRVKSWQSV